MDCRGCGRSGGSPDGADTRKEGGFGLMTARRGYAVADEIKTEVGAPPRARRGWGGSLRWRPCSQHSQGNEKRRYELHAHRGPPFG